jgi:hypothetical protein
VNKQEASAWAWSNNQAHAWGLAGWELGAKRFASYFDTSYNRRILLKILLEEPIW